MVVPVMIPAVIAVATVWRGGGIDFRLVCRMFLLCFTSLRKSEVIRSNHRREYVYVRTKRVVKRDFRKPRRFSL